LRFAGSPPTAAPPATGPLRLLYVGRLERRKGVHHLVHALRSLDEHGWQLTLVGGDTATGPLGGSLRASLELAAAGDPRIEFAGELDGNAVTAAIDACDVVVLPSLWECWPYTALEAMARNRPVLATPTGGYLEIVRPGVSGWFTAAPTPDALADTLRELVRDREAAAAPAAKQGPLTVARELSNADDIMSRS
jgi:glycosyltransferase involved in cell wall biosynthesis